MLGAILAQQARQDEVFKSISDNVSQTGDGMDNRVVLAIVLAVVGLILMAALFNARGTRAASPKAKKHSGKLLKELTKQIGIRPVELKQLKLLAQGERDAGNSIESPLVFILCPSTFLSAARAQRVKVDRKVMAGLAKKLGLVAPAKAKR